MKKWQKFVVINFGAVIGVTLSIFVVPPSTPVWEWAIISAACIAVLNVLLWRRLKKGSAVDQRPKLRREVAILGGIGTLIFLIEVIYHLYRYYIPPR